MPPKTRIRKKARRDVRAAYAPAINTIDRAIDTAGKDYDFRDQQVQNIYQGLQDILQPQGRRYDTAVEGVLGDYTKAISDFSSAFSDSFAPAQAIGGPVGDAAAQAATAASDAYGTIGTGGIKLLSDARERNANFFGRMNTVGGLAEKDARLNALSDYESLIEDLKNRRLDLRGEMGSSILTRIDELRQQRMDNRLARKQFQLNREQIESQEDLADYLIGHIGDEAARRRRRNRDRGGAGQGGGGGQGGGATGINAAEGGAGGPGGSEGGGNPPLTRIERLQQQMARLTGNDVSQDAAILNMFEEQYGYPAGSNAEIFMQDGKVYVRAHPDAPAQVVNDPRAVEIRQRHNREARRVERKKKRIRRIKGPATGPQKG